MTTIAFFNNKGGVGKTSLAYHLAWMYADRGGLLEVLPRPTELVSRDERVAVLRNAFGDIIREYHAPQDGVVIGKSVNPVGQTGARILHLGIPTSPEHGFQRRALGPPVLEVSR